MKKIIIIFLSLICLTNAEFAIPNVVEKIKDLVFGCCTTKTTHTITSPKIIQELIDQNKQKVEKFIHKTSNFFEPLPFSLCTKPALFDLAMSNKNKELVDNVLQKEDFNICTFVDGKNNLFHICAESGSNRILSKLLEHCKKHSIDYQDLLNQQDALGQTPLTLSVLNCRTECLKILLAHNAQHVKINLPLLHIAAATDMRGEKKRNKTVKILLEAKHSPWEIDSIQRTAQDVAQACSYQSTVDCIQNYKKSFAEKVKATTGNTSYLSLLPSEIFSITLKRLIDEPADFASAEKPQLLDQNI